MALIVEVLQPRGIGVASRRRLASMPFTVGRALDNALVLDDPYVDAHHAVIERDAETGDVFVRDLGSVNGIIVELRQHAGNVRVRGGAEVRLGRTTLRFRDEAEPLPPALPLNAARPSGEPRRWHEQPVIRLALCLVAYYLLGVWTFSTTYDRSGAAAAVGVGIGFALIVAMWAGVWALVARSFIQQARFGTHFTIATLMILAVTGLGVVEEWFIFLWPATGAWSMLSGISTLGLLTVSIAWHLAHATHLPRARRWRAGAVTAVVVVALGGLFALAADEGFTDVPTYSGIVRPLKPSLVPTIGVEELREAHADLRRIVDSLPNAR